MWSAEPDELCFVLVYFQSVTIHPVADLFYTYQELFNFVVCHWYVSMKIQLTVVCVGMYSKAMSMSNSHYIRTRVSVGHPGEPCKRMNRSSADPKKHILASPGEHGWSIRARRRWCLTSNYCDHSLSRCYDLSIWMRGGWAGWCGVTVQDETGAYCSLLGRLRPSTQARQAPTSCVTWPTHQPPAAAVTTCSHIWYYAHITNFLR